MDRRSVIVQQTPTGQTILVELRRVTSAAAVAEAATPSGVATVDGSPFQAGG